MPGMMEMLDCERWADRMLRNAFQTPRPYASESVPLGDKVDKASIRRPASVALNLRAVCHGNPFEFAGSFAVPDRGEENLSVCRPVDRGMKCDPAAII